MDRKDARRHGSKNGWHEQVALFSDRVPIDVYIATYPSQQHHSCQEQHPVGLVERRIDHHQQIHRTQQRVHTPRRTPAATPLSSCARHRRES